MRADLLVHVAAGSIGIVSGFVALSAAKGARLHRGSGRVFVYAMATMALVGAAIAALRNVAWATNVPAGLVTAYLVITGLTTVMPPTPARRRVDLGAMLVAIVGGAWTIAYGVSDIVTGGGKGDGVPDQVPVVFGVIYLLSGLSDIRIVRGAELKGPARLRRHLWRMCFALFIASGSFFLGQADEFPKELRVYPLLAVPVVAPLLAIVYWVFRVRVRRAVRGMVLRVREAT